MRSLRWLLLAVMIVIAATVFAIYQSQRIFQRSHRRASRLPSRSTRRQRRATGSGAERPAGRQTYAKNMKQAADSEHAELTDIELRIYAKDRKHYDRVKSGFATLTMSTHKLYAPGDVEITLQVPAEGDPPHRLTSITTSGINFDSESGQAVTDKHVTFTFEEGDGTADGATYDRTATISRLMPM